MSKLCKLLIEHKRAMRTGYTAPTLPVCKNYGEGTKCNHLLPCSHQMSFEGKNCDYYDDETENNCHHSMFVRRKCKEGCCPELDQYCDDAEVMHGRLLHATSGGLRGNWEDRDIQSSTPEQDKEAEV